MTHPAMACPTQQQLADFSAGKLNATDSVEIERHLADCDSCCQMLKMLPDENTLVSLLRDPQMETATDGRQDRPAPDAGVSVPPGAEPPTVPPGASATEVARAASGDVAAALPEPLRRHARYRITKLLGRGGMGSVYKAQHRMMNRAVALKVINAQLVNSHAAIQRFHREVQAAARLAHPNIVTAHDAEQAGDAHFLVMEFVEGIDLAALLRERGPLPVAEACDYVRQAAEGLQHAHELGMVHRDIKPQNLMIGREQRSETARVMDGTAHAAAPQPAVVKILDFGLAGFASETVAEEAEHSGEAAAGPAHLTLLGSMMGTPDYISPEQARDAHSADIRSDIYSLGCTLYCLLTGDPPFAGDSVLDKVMAHVEREPKPLGRLRDDIPAELDTVVRRMMAKHPDERYQTPAEVAEALRPLAGQADPTTAEERRWLDARRLVQAPADGIAISGLLHLVPLVIVLAMGGVEAVSGLAASLVVNLAFVAVPLVPFMIWGALRMRRLQSLVLARIAATLSIIPLTPASLLGIPMGLWALRVLHRADVASAFRNTATVGSGLAGRARTPSSRRLSWAMAGGGAALAGIVIYLATDTGQLEIDARAGDLPGAKIVLLKNGRDYATFQLQPGAEPQTVRAGQYEVQLRNVPPDVEIGVRSKRRGSRDWGAPDNHDTGTVVLYRGGGILVEVTRAPSGELTDHGRLQGEWIAESGERNGQPTLLPEVPLQRMTFDGDTVEVDMPGGMQDDGRFQLVASTQPRQIRVVPTGDGDALQGIYELDGDRLRLCMDRNPAGQLPGSFAAPAGTTLEVITLRRCPDDVREAAAAREAHAWLRLVDGARYLECWEALAAFAKELVTAAQIEEVYPAVRSPLGVPHARSLQGANLFTQLPGTPAGESMVVQFETTFSTAGKQLEQVTLYWDDGRWRVMGYHVNPVPAAGVARAADSDLLQGKWVAMSAQYRAKDLSAEELSRFWIRFHGDQVQLSDPHGGGVMVGKFSIDESRMPRHLDLGAPDGSERMPGIYELDGDRLKVAWIDEDYARPADFVPGGLADHITAVFERASLDAQMLDATGQQVVASAEVFLAAMDEGKFGSLWNMSASWAKRHSSRSDVSNVHQHIRDTLGKAVNRILQRVQVIDSPAGSPAGQYAAAQYRTDFERRTGGWEWLILNVDTDGAWRVNTYQTTTHPMPFPAPADRLQPTPPRAEPPAPTPPPGLPVGENLISDPSLEASALGARYPAGWGSGNLVPPGSYRHQVVGGGRTGSRAWSIEGDGRFATVPTDRVPALPAYRYAAVAWVKAEAMSAQIKLLYFSRSGEYLGENRSAATLAGDDWHRVTMVDDLEKFPEAARLSLALAVTGEGMAIFDDLELLAFDAAKLPSDFELEYASSHRHPAMLDRWVGHWETATEYRATGETPARSLRGENVVHQILDNRFLLWDVRGEQGDTQFLAILGFDDYIDAYHLWLFGPLGEVYERTGPWDEAAQMLSLEVQPPAPGITGFSTDRFRDDDHIESTLLVKSADGQVTRDVRGTWTRKSRIVTADIEAAGGPDSDDSRELTLLDQLAGDWTIHETLKPSIWFPEGGSQTVTERAAWVLGGRFLMLRSYDDRQRLTMLALVTWEPEEKSYRYWHFAGDVFGGEWRITWDASSRAFHWHSIDMPAGWIGTGYNRWIDDDTFDNEARIKDEGGRVLLDSQQTKKRIR